MTDEQVKTELGKIFDSLEQNEPNLETNNLISRAYKTWEEKFPDQKIELRTSPVCSAESFG